jgi:hypothetical protein
MFHKLQAIALFNANEHEEALLLVEQLAADPNADPLVCRVVEVSIVHSFVRSLILMCLRFAYKASLRVQLGTIAFEGAHHNEAVDHFAAAVKASTFLAKVASPFACKAFTLVC